MRAVAFLGRLVLTEAQPLRLSHTPALGEARAPKAQPSSYPVSYPIKPCFCGRRQSRHMSLTMKENQIFQKIISGGQTGADQGALDAALELGHPCGGWCPRGRRSEAGPISQRYPVTEHSSESYQVRTEANIIDSDGTLVFTCGEPTGGTKETIDLAQEHGKPCFILDLEKSGPTSDLGIIRKWGEENQVTVLNVAGPRESKNPGISARVKQTILQILHPGRE